MEGRATIMELMFLAEEEFAHFPPCEDTEGRRKEDSHQNLAMVTPQSQTSSLQNNKK
jgi:hypothetical protein